MKHRGSDGGSWLSLYLALFAIVMALISLNSKAEDREIFDEPGVPERIQKDERITSVLITLVMFKSYAEMVKYMEDEDIDFGYDVEGFSDCELIPTHNTSHCVVYIVEPDLVDGWNELVLGHEVLHGVFGAEYHK